MTSAFNRRLTQMLLCRVLHLTFRTMTLAAMRMLDDESTAHVQHITIGDYLAFSYIRIITVHRSSIYFGSITNR
jgi:hypothetical protein